MELLKGDMKKILLVEDDSLTSESYLDQLSSDNFEISFLRSGEEVIAEALSFKPDLMLLDIMLAGKMNGFDVLDELRSKDELKDLPVIVLTNLDDQQKTADSYQAAGCYVKAETDFETIRTKIYEVLGVGMEERPTKDNSSTPPTT